MSFEPVVLFFLLGVIAGLLRSDLKIPGSIYDALSVYLLLAIGLQGGVKLASYPLRVRKRTNLPHCAPKTCSTSWQPRLCALSFVRLAASCAYVFSRRRS